MDNTRSIDDTFRNNRELLASPPVITLKQLNDRESNIECELDDLRIRQLLIRRQQRALAIVREMFGV